MDVLDRSQTAKPTIDLSGMLAEKAFDDCICKEATILIILLEYYSHEINTPLGI